MPELPEVETLCRQLREKIAGKRIGSTMIYDHKLDGVENVRGRIIREVRRAGKNILIILDDGQSIAIHLRMTGRLLWRQSLKREPYTRWRMRVPGGSVDLVDPRRFATVKITPKQQVNAGKDIINGFDQKAFLERQAKRKVSVKVLLMDPKAIAGIGNIYACEILHQAGISPLRPTAAVSVSEWEKIIRYAGRILKKGIENRGTSISDWRDLYGCPGENQKELKVYGQAGRTCSKCGGIISRIKQSGRSTFYCPACQK